MLAAGPGPAGHYGIGEATDLYLLGFYPVTSGLCCGTVHHPGGGKKKRITPGFGGNVSCKTTAQSTYEGTDQESCCVSLSSATSFVVLCVDSFPRPGPGVLSCFRLCGQ